MARKSSKEIRNRNKPQRLVNREFKSKRSDKAQKDKRDIFAEKMVKQLATIKDAE